MRSTVRMPVSVDPRDQVAGPDTASLPLHSPARFKKTPRAILAVPPSTAARRAGGDRMTIRVVVAEDHPVVREGVMRALVHDSAIEVVGAADDGVTAMELAHELEPDVMLLDLNMPGLGGAGVLERLRTELPHIRALVMSADESPESVLHTVGAGAIGYLSKGTTGEQLRQAVITTYGGGSVISPALAGHLRATTRAGGSAASPHGRCWRRASSRSCASWPTGGPTKRSPSSCTSAHAPCRTT
jgi:DNA-binding NarL/FixJ family response regulator